MTFQREVRKGFRTPEEIAAEAMATQADAVITDAMLQAAMKKAVELGFFPAHADTDTYMKQWDGMKAVLQAAVAAA